jgi:DNA-binding transcriptional LysR family regulator
MRYWDSRIEGRYYVDDNGCHIWTGAKCSSGYARVNGGLLLNRLIQMDRFGPVPPWLFTCHTCNVRGCINPDHIYLGTHDDNMRDYAQTDDRKGEGNPSAKLTAEDVMRIRQLASSGLGVTTVARMMGISHSNCSRIVHRKNWKHI